MLCFASEARKTVKTNKQSMRKTHNNAKKQTFNSRSLEQRFMCLQKQACLSSLFAPNFVAQLPKCCALNLSRIHCWKQAAIDAKVLPLFAHKPRIELRVRTPSPKVAKPACKHFFILFFAMQTTKQRPNKQTFQLLPIQALDEISRFCGAVNLFGDCNKCCATKQTCRKLAMPQKHSQAIFNRRQNLLRPQRTSLLRTRNCFNLFEIIFYRLLVVSNCLKFVDQESRQLQ